MSVAMSAAVEVDVRPPSPFRMPRWGGEDRVMRVSDGVAARLLHVDGCPVLVRAWEPVRGVVRLRSEPVEPASIASAFAAAELPQSRAGRAELELAIERMRFALGVDDDLSEFYRRFRRDPLLGPLLRRRPHLRLARRPWAWEALAWAVVKQLIETGAAARIQRRIVGRWGLRLGRQTGSLRDMPPAAVIAGRAPAEIESMGLALKRAIALRRIAGQVAAGRCEPAGREADDRLLRIPEIGPWTVQCLGLFGRGEPDSLPAGDLMFLKQVGRLARLGRRATVAEVEEFYAPYAPFRGLAGAWAMTI